MIPRPTPNSYVYKKKQSMYSQQNSNNKVLVNRGSNDGWPDVVLFVHFVSLISSADFWVLHYHSLEGNFDFFVSLGKNEVCFCFGHVHLKSTNMILIRIIHRQFRSVVNQKSSDSCFRRQHKFLFSFPLFSSHSSKHKKANSFAKSAIQNKLKILLTQPAQ